MAQTIVFDRESVPGGWFDTEATGAWFDADIVTTSGGGGGAAVLARRTLHDFGTRAGGRTMLRGDS